ncbi:MAG: acyl-CoA dehydrogenase family protein [Gammaproteobacteria bacterium]
MNDLLQIEHLLSDEERLIQDSVRHFVDVDVIPIMESCYEKASFPTHLISKIAKLGLLGMTLPEQYGGANASYVNYGLVCQELERGDSGIRSFVSVQSSLCMFPIFRYGSEEQKQHYLPKMASGELIGCFGLTEPDVGSDPASMKTTAKKVAKGWILNGAKLWITNATIADIAVVWAHTDEGIRGFIIPKETKGFSCNEITHKLSLRASVTGELVFQDCFVPDECFLPGSVCGLSAPLSCLNQARYGIAWGVLGAAMFCFDTALAYCKERIQFHKPIASFQLVQSELVAMFTEICKAQTLTLHIGRLKDQDKADFNHVSLIKRNNCREALKIARQARNLLGANGISLAYHVIRHMNNLESVFTYEGTDHVHTLVLGKYLTEISAFD